MASVSTVLRPSGPLPPRVYWRRRLALVVVLVLLATAVWWFFAGRTSADGGRQPSGHAAAPAEADTTAASSPSRRSTPKAAARRPGSGEAADKPKSRRPRPAAPAPPEGPCLPSAVKLEIDVSDGEAGQPNSATLLFSSTRAAACTLDITARTLAVRVTSGSDVVWSSEHCPDALRAKQLVVRVDPPTAYTFPWSGHRSAEGCSPVTELPEAGGYWVEAALIGGDPQRAYFDLTNRR